MSNNTHDFHIYLPKKPVDVWAKLKALAKANKRPVTQEARLAIEDHLQKHEMLSYSEIQKLKN